MEKFKYIRAITYLILLLIGFMAVVDTFLILRQRDALIDNETSHTKEELTLLGFSTEEALLRGDYAPVKEFLNEWVRENPKIASFKAITPNGFTLVDYKRQTPALNVIELTHTASHSGRNLIKLEIKKDISLMLEDLTSTAIRYMTLSLVFALIFGIALWGLFRATALKPMENMLKELEDAKNTLEEKVIERTKELALSNETLQREITERKTAEKKLLSMIEAEPECVKILSTEGIVLSMNPAGLAMLDAESPEQVVGRSISEFIAPEYKEGLLKFHQDILSGRRASFIFESIGLKGTRRWLESYAVPFKDESDSRVAVLAVTRDITEKVKLEEQLRHTHKMEALGTLTGGIAHEFNNILMAIMGYTELLDEVVETETQKNYVKMIKASAERAARLTKGLLAYSRKQIVHLSPLDLNTIVSEVSDMLSNIIAENIEIKLITNENPLIVLGDKSQLEQVIMNLAANAVDAMPLGGVLTISLEELTIDEAFVKNHGFATPGTYALLCITDTGIGMDRETIQKVFEPFFTTKDIGKGTGLGLSIVYGIVKKHGGYVNIYSEPKKGTTVKVYLPLTEKSPEVEKSSISLSYGGHETILLAEDDDSVRALIKTLLERAGYKVIEAIDGKDAVEKFSSSEDSIHLLLFDVVMPKMNGFDAYTEIRKLSPDIKVAFISGYPAGTRNEISGLYTIISKPVVQSELLRSIRDELDKDKGLKLF